MFMGVSECARNKGRMSGNLHLPEITQKEEKKNGSQTFVATAALFLVLGAASRVGGPNCRPATVLRVTYDACIFRPITHPSFTRGRESFRQGVCAASIQGWP